MTLYYLNGQKPPFRIAIFDLISYKTQGNHQKFTLNISVFVILCHPHLFSFLVLKHYSKPTQDVNLSFFSAYKRESWSTNTRNRELPWKDYLHLIWYRLHSVAGAMFHSRFLVLQTVSSQANQKVIHCCCYYLRWSIIKSLVTTPETG